jgi:drug/metabolite transporter (DMT)-like permease
VYALHLASAATIALLFGTAPVLVALVAHFSGSERLRQRSWIGALLSLAGVSLLVASGGGVSGSLAGLLLGLATAMTWAVYSVLVAPLMRRYSTFRLNAVVTVLGSIPLLAVAAPALEQEHWSGIGPLAWLAFAYSLFAYVVGNVIWFVAIRRVGPSHAALYINVEPFLGAMFAVLVLSEGFGILQIAGGVVIALAIVVARRDHLEVPLAE